MDWTTYISKIFTAPCLQPMSFTFYPAENTTELTIANDVTRTRVKLIYSKSDKSQKEMAIINRRYCLKDLSHNINILVFDEDLGKYDAMIVQIHNILRVTYEPVNNIASMSSVTEAKLFLDEQYPHRVSPYFEDAIVFNSPILGPIGCLLLHKEYQSTQRGNPTEIKLCENGWLYENSTFNIVHIEFFAIVKSKELEAEVINTLKDLNTKYKIACEENNGAETFYPVFDIMMQKASYGTIFLRSLCLGDVFLNEMVGIVNGKDTRGITSNQGNAYYPDPSVRLEMATKSLSSYTKILPTWLNEIYKPDWDRINEYPKPVHVLPSGQRLIDGVYRYGEDELKIYIAQMEAFLEGRIDDFLSSVKEKLQLSNETDIKEIIKRLISIDITKKKE